MTHSNFALDLKQARMKAELSQADLAFLAGLHPSTISRLELGRTKLSRKLVHKINIAFFVSAPPI